MATEQNVKDKPAVKGCKHAGYLVRDGQLVCASCGEPSPSQRWRQNVFGAQNVNSARAEG